MPHKFVYSNFLSLKGWVAAGATCFTNNMVSTKSPPYSLFPTLRFLSHLAFVHWSSYHTVRKPVRQTPNKDECPRRQKRKVRLFSRCRLNFPNVSFVYYSIYPTSLGLINMQIYAYICAYSSCAIWRLCVILFKRNFLKNPTGKLVEMELRDS